MIYTSHMEKLLEALYFATTNHGNQTRKGVQTPYISHPLAVALILSSITDDQDVIIAGILHDLIEDAKVSEAEIKKRFGKKVSDMVMDCSEKDKSKSWKERKQCALESIKNLPKNSGLVKTADILHNIYELANNVNEHGISFFDNFNSNSQDKLAYERKRLEKFKRYHKNNPLLEMIEESLSHPERMARE